MYVLGQIFILAVVVTTVVFVLPKMSRWTRVGFWLILTVVHVLNDDAFLAAISAAFTVSEWHKP